MSKAFNLFDNSQHLNETGLICTLSKVHSVTIPKIIRNTLQLKTGVEVTISLRTKSNDIVIQKNNGDASENKMVLNNRGSVRIPAEIIKLMYLNKGDIFKIYLASNNIFILLRKRS
ncbi:hypothetical protein [Oceanobacillus massiliensis]|uniref:hypothetical protein n=1 Tax=Oceanobacillus massiliensis TaxID=1465765 RepID=UPI00028851D9|nr:hypothetical protein [Oceanobacillus massiliensis]